MASTDAKPVPQKNVAYRVTFPILDADGDLVTGAAGLDSEISKDAGTFADCTNEATEIATSSGVYYLDLTSTEMNADTVAIIVKTSTSGAKTTTIVMYPEEAGDIRVNATQLNGTNLTGRDIGASVLLSSGTGTGQVTLTSGRVNADITHIATAAVSTSTAQLGVNVVNFGGAAGTFSGGRPQVNTSHWAGTAVGSTTVRANLINIAGSAVSTSTAQLGVNVVNAGGTAWASGSLTSGVFATGAITATAIAADAIGASELAADAIAEIADAVWDEDATAHQTQGSFGQAIGDPGADTDTIWGLANTNLDAAVSTRLASASYTAPLDAAGTRSAVGLASANLDTQLTAIDDYLDTEVAAIKAKTDNLPASPAATGDIPSAATVASAVRTELTTELGRIDAAITTRLASADYTAPDNTSIAAILTDTGTTLDGKIDAIKSKTDSLTFTVANQVDSNIKSVAGTTVTGVGTEADPWGP